MEVKKVRAILAQMQKNLECAICLEMMSNPISTNCGHQFCRFCIMEFLERKKQVPCPLCKKNITKRSLTERQQLGGMVNSIRQLISAFQTDSGQLFSPPRGSQAHVIPATPEPTHREPNSGTATSKRSKEMSGLDTDELLRCITEGLHGAADTEGLHGAPDTEGLHGAPDTEGLHGAAADLETCEQDTVDMDTEDTVKHADNDEVDCINDDPKSKLLLEMIENGSHGAVRSTDEETTETQSTLDPVIQSDTQDINQSTTVVKSEKHVSENMTNDHETLVLSGNSDAKKSDMEASENSSCVAYSLFRTPLDPKIVKKGKSREKLADRPRRSTRTKVTGKPAHDGSTGVPPSCAGSQATSDSNHKDVAEDSCSNIEVSFLDEKKIQHTYTRKVDKKKGVAGKQKVEEWLKHIPQCTTAATGASKPADIDNTNTKQTKIARKKSQKIMHEEDLMGQRIKHLSEKVLETNKDLLFHGESFMTSPKPLADNTAQSNSVNNKMCEEKLINIKHINNHRADSDKTDIDKADKPKIDKSDNEAVSVVAVQEKLLIVTDGIDSPKNEKEINEASSSKSSIETLDQQENKIKLKVPNKKKRIFKSRTQAEAEQDNKVVNVEAAEKMKMNNDNKHINTEKSSSDDVLTTNTNTNSHASEIHKNKVAATLDPFEFVSSQNTPVKPEKGKRNAKRTKSTKSKKLPLTVHKQITNSNIVKSKANKIVSLNNQIGLNSSHIDVLPQTASQIEIDKVTANLDQADNYEFLTCTQDALNEFAVGEKSDKRGKKKKVSFREPVICDFIHHGKVDVLGYRKAKAEVAAASRENKQFVNATREELDKNVDNVNVDERESNTSKHQTTPNVDMEINKQITTRPDVSAEGKENMQPASCEENDTASDDDMSEDWRFQEEEVENGSISSGTDDLDIAPTMDQYEQPNLDIQTEEMKAVLSQELFEKHVLLKSPNVLDQPSPDPSVIGETPLLLAVPVFNKLPVASQLTTTLDAEQNQQIEDSVEQPRNTSDNKRTEKKSTRRKYMKKKSTDSTNIEDRKESVTVVPETPLIPHDCLEDKPKTDTQEIKMPAQMHDTGTQNNHGSNTDVGVCMEASNETSQTSEETQAPSQQSGDINNVESVKVDEETQLAHTVSSTLGQRRADGLCHLGTCITIPDPESVETSHYSEVALPQTCGATDSSTQDSESLLLPQPKRSRQPVKQKNSRKRKRKCFTLEDDSPAKKIALDDENGHTSKKEVSISHERESIIINSTQQSRSAGVNCSQASVISVRSDSQTSEHQININSVQPGGDDTVCTVNERTNVEETPTLLADTGGCSVTFIPDSVVEDVSLVPDTVHDNLDDNSTVSTRRLSTLLSSVDQILEATQSSQEMKRSPQVNETSNLPRKNKKDRQRLQESQDCRRSTSESTERQRNVSGLLESPNVSQFGSPENIFTADTELPVVESSPMDDTLQPVQLSDDEEEDLDTAKQDCTLENSNATTYRKQSDSTEPPENNASLNVKPMTCSQKSTSSQENPKIEHVKKLCTPSPGGKRKSIKTARGFSKKQKHSRSPQEDSDTVSSPHSGSASTPKHLLNKSLKSSPSAKYKSPKVAVVRNLPLLEQSPISAHASPLLTPAGKRQQKLSTPAKSPLLSHINLSKYSPSLSKQKIENIGYMRTSFEPEIVDVEPDEIEHNSGMKACADNNKDSLTGTPAELPDIDGTVSNNLQSSSESIQSYKKKALHRSPRLILPTSCQNGMEFEDKHTGSRKNSSQSCDVIKKKLTNINESSISKKCDKSSKEQEKLKHLDLSDESNSSSDLNLDSLIEEQNAKDNCVESSTDNKDEDNVASSPEFTLDSPSDDDDGVQEQAMKVIDKFNKIKDKTKTSDIAVEVEDNNKPETKTKVNTKSDKCHKVKTVDTDAVYCTKLDSSPAQPEVILESDVESEDETEARELADDTDSEEDEIVRRKHVKKAVIDSSTDDDDDENSRHMNLTSSSAFSSQSENLTTQERHSLEKDLERMAREMENVKEQLKKNKKSPSPHKDGHSVQPISIDSELDSDMIEADDTGDEMEQDTMFVSLPPPSPPGSQEVTDRGDQPDGSDSKGDYSAGPEDTQPGNCEVMSASGDNAEQSKQEETLSESEMETVPPSLPDKVEDTTVTSVSNVSDTINTSTAKPGEKRPLGFVATGLSVHQVQEVKKLAALNDAKFYNRFNSAVTHVIVKPDAEDDLLCDRTLKFFQGVANKCWIVNHFWVVDSRQVGHILPESAYEIQGDTATGDAHQGPKTSRLSHKQLFTDMQFCLIGDNAYLSKDSMRELIETCGGHVEEVEDLDHSRDTAFVITCTDIEETEGTDEARQIQEQSQNLYRSYKILTLTREWVLDSITLYKLQPLHEYVVTNGKHVKIPKLSQLN